MIAADPQRLGQAGKNAQTIMMDQAFFAVHRLCGPDHPAAKSLADGLMTQTDAEDRDPAGKMADHLQGNPGLVRRAGTGGKDDPLGRQLADFRQGDLIVAGHGHFFPQFQKILIEVVDKRIIVVDHQDHPGILHG